MRASCAPLLAPSLLSDSSLKRAQSCADHSFFENVRCARSDVCTLHSSDPSSNGEPRWALVGNFCHPSNQWFGLGEDDIPSEIAELWDAPRVRAAAERQLAELPRPAL